MADDGIYRKTEKGRTEIATRANKLGQRERTMLIMVDDKTTRSGLLARSAHPGAGGMLDFLLAQGYIETDSGALPAAAPAVNAAVAVAPEAPQPAPVEVSLTSASRFACRALVTYLGPGADDLTLMIEKTQGAAELATALVKCREILQSLAGKHKADEFWAGVSARLPEIDPASMSAPPPAAPPPPPKAAVEVSLTSASRYACNALIDYLGPTADDLTATIEKAKGPAEFGIALEKCRRILQDLAGKAKADEFWAGVSARLPKA